MKKLIASGNIPISVYEDEYEGNSYQFIELQVSSRTIERVKLKSPSSYELLAMMLGTQKTVQNSNQTVKLNTKSE
ncbi:hypothetical protein [Lacrimispora sp.]|uniref:hypothetical protein n=1 Tax=Lacrimispora sp. TaxID=2719234 RepID=UPI00285FE9B4|nr:hypothetical protein [Lacrimispora sp.]MDR7810557.1 hypothetical protein [Lacrimispora sp.]